MNILPLVVGDLRTNCYLVSDPATSECLIIDPADEADFISTTILEHRLTPKAILLTHGHFDHCLGVLELKLNFNIPVYLHKNDLFLYQSAVKSAKYHTSKQSLKLPSADHFLEDGQNITFGNSSLTIIHTPGHTPGSVCFYSAPHLFTGDTLFAYGVGRTDLSYSSKHDLSTSLHELSHLPKDTLIYPGHEDFNVPLSQTTPKQL